MKKTRHIAVLGSTGSIGRNALEVISRFPDELEVAYLTAHKNLDLLKHQIAQFRPRGVVVSDERDGHAAQSLLNGRTEILVGEEGLQEVVARPDVDLVLSGLVGFAGLKPTLRAVEAGKDVALANKEALVVAGDLLTSLARKNGVHILPVDSEHSAILQCLRGEDPLRIARIILTASGGPFLHLSHEEFERVTVAQALDHPTWKMGNKITIDSATLMNKGLEVIEAFWLFGLPAEKIEVIVHPQSIIHSMVEFVDGSIKAQMSLPDMKLPIQYALMYPDRPAASFTKIDFGSLQQMTFLRPDLEKFRCLALAFEALAMGGSAPAVLNAANEIAVRMFMEGRISFASIPRVIEDALHAHVPLRATTLEDLVRVDRETRDAVTHSCMA